MSRPLTEPQIRALRAAEASPEGLSQRDTWLWWPTYRGPRTPFSHRTVSVLLARGLLSATRRHGIRRARITATGSAALPAR